MSSKILFGDLKRQHVSIKDAIDVAVQEVLDSGWYILGKHVEAFEQEFAAYCGVDFAVSVASGTDAIHLALVACGVGENDEVITVANTAVPTVSAIREARAMPVFVDIDEKTCLMDVARVEAKITPRTKAIVPVHLYGQPVDLTALLEIAKKHNIVVIEDCAQAHGAQWHGQKVGFFGIAGCFSFYPSKNLGAYGDGGIIVTNDEALAEKVRSLRFYGFRKRDYCQFEGFNSRLDEIQAALLRVKLQHLEGWNERRRAIAHIYGQVLQDTDILIPAEAEPARHVYHLYVVRSRKRDALREYLASQGVMTGIHYPVSIHLQEGYRFLGYHAGDLPVTESVTRQILSLPMYPELTDAEIDFIGEHIVSFDKSKD